MQRRTRILSLSLTLALVALNLIALNILVAPWTRGRIDMTQDRIYSISPATRKVLANLNQPVTIYGYFSKKTHPKLAPLVPQIVDLLDEYRAVSDGKVRVEIVDPSENAQAEHEANDRFGVHSVPFQFASKYEASIVNAYFSIVVRYGDQYKRYDFSDLIDVHPEPNGDVQVKLGNLEYDLTRAIRKTRSQFEKGMDLFSSLQKPAKLTIIMTPKTLPEVFKDVPAAIKSAADELEAKGGKHFVFKEIDPSTSPALESQVEQEYGARPMALGLGGGQPFFLYGILQIGNDTEQLSLARQSISAASIREDVEKALRRHTPGLLQTVGIVAPGPSIPPEVLAQLRARGQAPRMPPPEFEEVKQKLQSDYAIKNVSLEDPNGVPYDIDVLLVIKPRNLSDKAVYNLDQYLMRGGRVIICSGHYNAELGQGGLEVTPAKTGLGPWLAHLGLTIRKTLVLDDQNQPLPVPQVQNTPFGRIQTWRLAPYPYLVHVEGQGIVNREIASSLNSVGIYWGSPIKVDKAKTKGFVVTPLLRSSKKSWTDDDTTKTQRISYDVPSNASPQLLAVALSGRFPTFFDQGAPNGAGDPKGASKPPANVSAPIKLSPQTRLIVVGNSEFISDLVARVLSNVGGDFFTENLRFVENLVDWSTLDPDMISIRSRNAGPRLLEQTGRKDQVAIELANYLIPMLILIAIGFWRFWKRRHVQPITKADAGATAFEGGRS